MEKHLDNDRNVNEDLLDSNSTYSLGKLCKNRYNEKCSDTEYCSCKDEIVSDLFTEDYPVELSTSSKIIELQKTPHSDKHKTHWEKIKRSNHCTIQTTIKKQRAIPAPMVKFSNYEEIWSNMVNREEITQKSRNSNIFADRTTFLPRMRAILLDWIMEVCEVYRLRRNTYYLAVDYIDRYLNLSPSVPKGQLQLLGISCLFIASKLEEIYPPKLTAFSYICDGACTETDILACELLLLKTLHWDVNPMTPTTWLNLYIQICYKTDHSRNQVEVDSQNNFYFPQYSAYQFVRASHLIDLFSVDPEFLRFNYSVIAAGAMYYIFGKEVAILVSGYEWKQLKACVEYMLVFDELIQDSLDTSLQSTYPQDIDKSFLGNFRFLRGKVPYLIDDEAHCMQTHVVDLGFFEKATLLRLEQLGLKVEKTLDTHRKIMTKSSITLDNLEDGVDEDAKESSCEKENECETHVVEETTTVMYEVENILDKQRNKCMEIFQMMDDERVRDDDVIKGNDGDDSKVVNIFKINRKTKLSFDDILSSLHNDYYEYKYR